MPTLKRKRKLKTLARYKKLSSLLALALKDLRKQERAKNCRVKMYVWWMPKGTRRKTCVTCLAGSVMKYSLRKPDSSFIVVPRKFDAATESRLWALDALRRGQVYNAAIVTSLQTNVSDRSVPRYEDDRDGWWSAMRQLLKELRAAGE